MRRTPLPRVGGYVDPRTVFSFLGPDRVLFVNSRTHRTFAVSARGPEQCRRTRRLPLAARLSFSGPRFGFALSPFGHPPVLALSTDGGVGWMPTVPVDR